MFFVTAQDNSHIPLVKFALTLSEAYPTGGMDKKASRWVNFMRY